MNNKLYNQALEYLRLGWSVIPVSKNKKPAMPKWYQFKERKATEQELKSLFSRKNVTGIGVVCGPVSGNLAVVDFDDHFLYEAWTDDQPELAEALPTSMSGRAEGGFHVYCRCKDIDSGQKFFEGEVEILWGKYAVLPPSLHPSGNRYWWANPPGKEVPEVSITAFTGSFTAPEQVKKPSCNLLDSLVSSYITISASDYPNIVRQCLPERPNTNHYKLFKLCLLLQRIQPRDQWSEEDLRIIINKWFKDNKFTRHSFDSYWLEFLDSWERVKYAEPAFGPAVRRAIESEPPAKAKQHFSDPKIFLLASICRELQVFHGDAPFFLSCATISRVLELDHPMTAWRYLQGLCRYGIIKLAEKGLRKGKGSKASKFFYQGE